MEVLFPFWTNSKASPRFLLLSFLCVSKLLLRACLDWSVSGWVHTLWSKGRKVKGLKKVWGNWAGRLVTCSEPTFLLAFTSPLASFSHISGPGHKNSQIQNTACNRKLNVISASYCIYLEVLLCLLLHLPGFLKSDLSLVFKNKQGVWGKRDGPTYKG